MYTITIPSYIQPYLQTKTMQRLKYIDMNCGIPYTSMQPYASLQPYNRYEHSLRVACLLHHFHQPKHIVLAGLFHDCATPVFSHTIDFMNGDYAKQESTEANTTSMMQKDSLLMHLLQKDCISISSVCDYHMYPIADNDSPQLSCNRLEYTFSNMIDYNLGTKEDVHQFLEDIVISENEYNQQELVFQHASIANAFTHIALQLGKIYSSNKSRFAMEMLSRIIQKCLDNQIIYIDDLWKEESFVIEKIQKSNMKEDWIHYTHLCDVQTSDENGIILQVKKRWIDPIVLNRGRVSRICDTIGNDISNFIEYPMDEKLSGVYRDER